MDLQQRLTALAMTAATAMMWIVAGLAVGGVAVAIARAVDLLGSGARLRPVPVRSLRRLRNGRALADYACRLQ